MKVFYDEGVAVQKFGPHELRINVPKEIPDEDAQTLIKKGRVKQSPDQKPQVASRKS